MSKIKGRFMISGELHLESPLLISTGEKGYTDIVIQKDEKGIPFIPASSVCGVLRHYFYNNLMLEDEDKKQLEYFWGSEKEKMSNELDTYQSSFILQDLHAINNPKIMIRDGIKIDNKLGIAEDEKKFDYEVVEPGAVFAFNAKIILREKFSEKIFFKIIGTIVKALSGSEVYFGAMTTKGFGRCRLLNYKLYKYDYRKKEDVISWLKEQQREEQIIKVDFKNIFMPKADNFMLNATFNIKNSLIVKSYSGLPGESDAVHISSGGQDIIPGTSIKGAIRARAIKIINTLGRNGEEMVKGLFGWAPEKSDGEKQKSRFIVEEAQIKHSIKETQFRTKIDRFTGGVKKTALFDSTPVWGNDNKTEVTINIKVDGCEPWEAGLMLLLLKDLWNEDLPFGGEKNIGRGILKGKSANLSIKNNYYTINQDGEQLKVSGDKEELESLVRVFAEKCKGEGA